MPDQEIDRPIVRECGDHPSIFEHAELMRRVDVAEDAIIVGIGKDGKNGRGGDLRKDFDKLAADIAEERKWSRRFLLGSALALVAKLLLLAADYSDLRARVRQLEADHRYLRAYIQHVPAQPAQETP